MCVHRSYKGPGQQLGIPLDNFTLNAMEDVDEKLFWIMFLEQAQYEISEHKEAGETMPYTPSDSLREKYEIALMQYNGSKYCQVRQLQQIFAFPVLSFQGTKI
jgi:hypothetical protein